MAEALSHCGVIVIPALKGGAINGAIFIAILKAGLSICHRQQLPAILATNKFKKGIYKKL